LNEASTPDPSLDPVLPEPANELTASDEEREFGDETVKIVSRVGSEMYKSPRGEKARKVIKSHEST
jgi:hypothetical protein